MTSTRRDIEALARLSQAFAACPRPAHFTDFTHCEECAEHDRTLLSRTPASLRIDEVGNAAWDPICFISPAGFAYYLPGLARLALEDCAAGWYGGQLFSHLTWDGPGNERFRHCSPAQRHAVAEFIVYLLETRSAQITRDGLDDDCLRALEIWSVEEAPMSSGLT
jgi:hypothetical protein